MRMRKQVECESESERERERERERGDCACGQSVKNGSERCERGVREKTDIRSQTTD